MRVYALETGGNGTADMQAGVHPITKKGHPISSALGYAQLLHANTIGELVKHGDSFIARLRKMAAATRDPARAQELHDKIVALQRMLHAARSVPRRLVPPRRFRADAARLRHARDQSRRRHRALAAVGEAQGAEGVRRAQRRHQPLRRGDRAHEPVRPGDGSRDDAARGSHRANDRTSSRGAPTT